LRSRGEVYEDATNSILSLLRLNQHSAGVLKGSYAITTDAGYQRFRSNFAVGEAQRFERDIVLREADSTLFGPGSFLIDVQAHGWDMDAGTGNDAPAVPKRERANSCC
jgi:hypothetical protein